MNALEDITKILWIGDEWIRGDHVLSSTPRHDPQREIDSGASLCSDGSTDMHAVVDADTAQKEMRVYRLESHANDWKNRAYEPLPHSDEPSSAPEFTNG